MRITFWLVILLLVFFAYAFFGFIALQECAQRESIYKCLFIKADEPRQ